MEFRQGIGVSPGIAIAEAFILDYEDVRITPFRQDEGPEACHREVERFERGLEAAVGEMQAISERIQEEVGDAVSSMFTGFSAILLDKKLKDDIVQKIRDNRFTAEYAVSRAFRKVKNMFRAKDNEFFASRLRDIGDIENRLLRHLVGEHGAGLKHLSSPVVLIAKDLSPSQTATLPRDKIVGFATDAGGRTSHTAILAKSLGIPAVVGLKAITSDVSGGDLVILDGSKGRVIVAPDATTQRDYRARRQRQIEFARGLDSLRDVPAETLDGHLIRLQANIEYPHEIPAALEKGAQGIGLYRTEFLYGPDQPNPTEEDHFEAYSSAITELAGRPLVIRTLDLGADKFLPEKARHEANPFLGSRSIRYCFERIDLFKAQLRAIYRASALGPVSIMLPMISALSELKKARSVIQDVVEELQRGNVRIDADIDIGCMIEVPSAAIAADILARETKFFSIGTNDLVQYTLAVDRTNERVAHLYQPAHPAVFRLIWQAVAAAHRERIGVSLCGELAGEVMYVIPLIGLGCSELSMSSSQIPTVKKVIRSITMRDAKRIVERIFKLSDARETESFLRERVRQIEPELL